MQQQVRERLPRGVQRLFVWYRIHCALVYMVGRSEEWRVNESVSGPRRMLCQAVEDSLLVPVVE